MIYSLDELTGAPREVKIAGRIFRVSRLSITQLGMLEAYLKDITPSPLDEFKKIVADGAFTPEERAELFRDAKSRMEPQYREDGFQLGGWPPSVNSVQGQKIVFSGPALPYFLWLVIRRHQPDFTREEADSLAPHLEPHVLEKLMRLMEHPTDPNIPDDSEPDRTDLPPGYVNPNA